MIEKIKASALNRVMNCSGSYLAEKPLPKQDQNDAAKEGDAAHWCATYINDHKGELGKPGKKAPNGWVTDQVMWNYAADYVAAVTGRGDFAVDFETEANWQATPKLEVRCRIDSCGYDAENETLYIDDFKYGFRVVDVTYNWSLIAYAVGKVRSFQILPKRIVLSIYQPRPYHPEGAHRSWEITCDELIRLHDKLIYRFNNLDNVLKTGPWCTHCKAAPANCSAVRTASFNAVDVIMDSSSNNLSTDEHAYELALLERAQKVVKERFAWLEDLATSRIKEGEIIPGYYLKKSYGKSQWNTKKAVTELAKSSGIKLFDRLPVTPAEAIRRGVDEDLVKEHTNRPQRGVKLAKGSSAELAKKVFNK